jgi:exportin-7
MALFVSILSLLKVLVFFGLHFNSRRSYGFLFDWLYPAHMPILLKGIVHYADVPEVCYFFFSSFDDVFYVITK